jgi:hypothetical protein
MIIPVCFEKRLALDRTCIEALILLEVIVDAWGYVNITCRIPISAGYAGTP